MISIAQPLLTSPSYGSSISEEEPFSVPLIGGTTGG
jgi:hypothetical protein